MIQFQNDVLTVFQSALYQTTTAIIQTDEAILMTDPNFLPHEIEEIKNYIQSIIENRTLYIIYTHHDFDHIIAAGAFPNAKTIASKAFVHDIDQEATLNEIIAFDKQYYINRTYPVIYPHIDFIIDKDDMQLTFGEVTCTFYLAPGHTTDGLVTVIEPYGIMLAGDYLSDVEFPFIDHVQEYVETADKLKQMVLNKGIQMLVPGHGQSTANKEEIMARVNNTQNYLQDLQQGIDQSMELKRKYKFIDSIITLHEENKSKL